MAPPTNLRRPATKDRLKSKKKLTKKVYVPIDPEPHEAYEAAERDLERVKILEPDAADKIGELTKALELARIEAEEATETLVFQSIGRKAYDALVEANPPTQAQIEEFQLEHSVENDPKTGDPIPNKKVKPPYNVDTFSIELIAASMVEPKLTPEEVDDLIEDWNETEIMSLWVAALEVNTQRRVAAWGND